MERGRFSKEYAQFLCDRFYLRYKETAFIKVECITSECSNTCAIRANAPDDVFGRIQNTFRCESCKRERYSSDSE